MKPPQTINVLDHHIGFIRTMFRSGSDRYWKINGRWYTDIEPGTRIVSTKEHGDATCLGFAGIRALAQAYNVWEKMKPGDFHWRTIVRDRGDTVWTPARVLQGNTIGTLESYNEKSFFQRNDNVTIAFYRIEGYRHLAVCWFDNETGARIA